MSDAVESQPEPVVFGAIDTIEPKVDSVKKTGPGTELAAYREARSWTIEHVAHQLNLAPRQIQALEADNHAALPGMASVRGFIRSYAKLLKVDAEPLLATVVGAPPVLLNDPIPMRTALSAPSFYDGRLPSMGAGRTLWRIIIVLVLVAGLIGIVGHRMGWLSTITQFLSLKTRIVNSAVVLKDSAPTATETEKFAPSDNIYKVDNAVNLMPPESGNASDNANGGANSVANTDTSSQTSLPVAADVAAPESIVQASKNKLVLTFRDPSWVEVRRLTPHNDGSGSVLISHLGVAGSTEVLDVTEPVSLVLGNAVGVDVWLRGAAIDLKPDVKNNVARLSLK